MTMDNIFNLAQNSHQKQTYEVFCRRNNYLWRMWSCRQKLRDSGYFDLSVAWNDDFLFVRSLLSSSHMLHGIFLHGMMDLGGKGTKKYQMREVAKDQNKKSDAKVNANNPNIRRGCKGTEIDEPDTDETFESLNRLRGLKSNKSSSIPKILNCNEGLNCNESLNNNLYNNNSLNSINTLKSKMDLTNNKNNNSIFNGNNSNNSNNSIANEIVNNNNSIVNGIINSKNIATIGNTDYFTSNQFLFGNTRENLKNVSCDPNYYKTPEKENQPNAADYSKYLFLDENINDAYNEMDEYQSNKYFARSGREMSPNLRLTTPDYQNYSHINDMRTTPLGFFSDPSSRPLYSDINLHNPYNDPNYYDQNSHFLPQNSQMAGQNPYFAYDEYMFYYDNPYVNSAPCVPNSNNLFSNVHNLGRIDEIDNKKDLLPSLMEKETRKLKVGARKKREIKNLAVSKDKNYVCFVCGIKDTPVWRRINKQKVCNACGLYFKNKRLRESKNDVIGEKYPEMMEINSKKDTNVEKKTRSTKNDGHGN